MAWQLFNNDKCKAKNTVIASLNLSNSRPWLSIGQKLVEAGFNEQAKYAVFFDEEGVRLALSESPDGRKVASTQSNRGISMRGFAQRFGITGKFRVFTWERENEKWVLPLTQVNDLRREK